MTRFRHFVAVLLLLFSVQFIVPASVWHHLCEHNDSEHCTSSADGETRLSEQHIHCLALELVLPHFHQQYFDFAFTAPVVLNKPEYFFLLRDVQGFSLRATGRGPPVVS